VNIVVISKNISSWLLELAKARRFGLLKYSIFLLAIMALRAGTFCSTFAVTLHTLAALVTRVDGHATGEQGASLRRRVPQTEQRVEPIAANETCHAEERLAEPRSTNQGVLPPRGWNAVFKAWRQQVQSIEPCAES